MTFILQFKSLVQIFIITLLYLMYNYCKIIVIIIFIQ